MKINISYKALAITVLLSVTVLMGVFNVSIGETKTPISEQFYDLEIAEKETNTSELSDQKISDKAFNEDKAYNALMKSFKSLKANDFKHNSKSKKANQKPSNHQKVSNSSNHNNLFALKNEETSTYQKLNKQLNKHLNNREENPNKSSLSYTLKGRTLTDYKTPRYLCEAHGKIVVIIKVNANGIITNAAVNTNLSSKNNCLMDYALLYAKAVTFNASPKNSQTGTITYLFKGK